MRRNGVRDQAVRWIRERLEHCDGEQQTKASLIEPILAALGYDTACPRQVSREYTADFGKRDGSAVDYALLDGEGNAVVLVEAKSAAGELTDRNRAQLRSYFSAAVGGDLCRTAILTNGAVWECFADLRQRRVLDAEPFFAIDFRRPPEGAEGDLERVAARAALDDSEARLAAMHELRIRRAFAAWLQRQASGPDAQFAEFLAQQIGGEGCDAAALLSRVIPHVLGGVVERRLRRPDVKPRRTSRVIRRLEVIWRGEDLQKSVTRKAGTALLAAALDRIWEKADRVKLGAALEAGNWIAGEGTAGARKVGGDGPLIQMRGGAARAVNLLELAACHMPEEDRRAFNCAVK